MSQSMDRLLSGVKSESSQEVYLSRIKSFLEFSKIGPDAFAKLSARKAETLIEAYVGDLKARVERKEIAKGTVRSCITPIRAFCLMNRMKGIEWGIIAKMIPTSKKYASDRAPTLDEVKALLSHAPLRLRAAILMQLSGGFRSGAFDYLSVRDVVPVGDGIASVVIYRGEPEEYMTYITPEAYGALKEYVAWRATHGGERQA